MARLLVAAAATYGATACEHQQRVDHTRASDSTTQVAKPIRPGVEFDPSSARPGQRVGVLVLESITAASTPIDSTLVGTAHFRGEIQLRGNRMAHPDADVRVPCFEADPLSASRLPRWRGDERRMWFCFTNHAATQALVRIEVGAPLSVVIDEFTINRHFSDEVNTARLIRVGE